MKITKKQLRRIIKEELARALSENVPVGDSMSRGKRFYSAAEKAQIKSFKYRYEDLDDDELEAALARSKNELERYAINSILAMRF